MTLSLHCIALHCVAFLFLFSSLVIKICYVNTFSFLTQDLKKILQLNTKAERDLNISLNLSVSKSLNFLFQILTLLLMKCKLFRTAVMEADSNRGLGFNR